MNMFLTLCAIVIVIATGSRGALGRSVTFYADGSIVELEATTLKGVVEIPLPAAMIEGSLRVKPDSSSTIQRVDIIPAAADTGKSQMEMDNLLEQKSRLGDRLQALATREEIFKSAAKSQSGKAPRKSKTNPEPMQSIRQGTEFAIAQLEAVYTARRRTEQEIRRLDNRIATLKGSGHGSHLLARIVLSPGRGKITVRYAVGGQGWTPRYDIYLNGSGSAQVTMSGQFQGAFAGHLLQASPALLSDSPVAKVYTVQPGPVAVVARYRLPVTDELFGTGMLSPFSFELKNTDSTYLPAGAANIYRNGEYVGRVGFEGISSGRSKKMSVGR